MCSNAAQEKLDSAWWAALEREKESRVPPGSGRSAGPAGSGQGLGREGCGFGEGERSGIQWAPQVCAICEISKQSQRQLRVCTPGVGETQIWVPSVERWYLWLGPPWGECTQGRREIGGTIPGSSWLGGQGEEGHPQRGLRRMAR